MIKANNNGAGANVQNGGQEARAVHPPYRIRQETYPPPTINHPGPHRKLTMAAHPLPHRATFSVK